jgi:hypothetical protein
MADQIVRDPSGQELGRIRVMEFGKLKAYDRQNAELGTYDPATDKTYDRMGLAVGNGNQLEFLISQAPQL